jgi:hexosaminidase
MKSKIAGIIFLSLAVTLFAAETNGPAIIPLPQKLELRDGVFNLTADTKIITDFNGRETGNFLVARLCQSTGWPLQTGTAKSLMTPVEGNIVLTTNDADTNLGAEGYELIVATNSVLIRAPTQAGLFYGVQTLLQLLPPEIFSANTVTNVDWRIPCVQIEDWPRFQWRGLMLDVSRHFYDKGEVETILDEMALHKLNTFHWHLTDDQGWRIEIKKYPKLTQTGAWRTKSELAPPNGRGENSTTESAHPAWAEVAASKFGADGRYGGFYSQDDIREVVAYAAARHITIVPEIEMPGHAVAALAAYPQFSCDGGPYSTDEKAGVNKGVFDPGNPATFKFLDEVLSEVFKLFPGKYIHVGGDEVNGEVKAATWEKSPLCRALMKREELKNADELQGWFTRRIGKFVNAHGKTLVGWSEIADGGLVKNAVIMDWKGGGLEAAGAGHDVVMTPTGFVYLDHYQSTNHAAEPHAIGGFLPLEQVYSFEPVPVNLAPEFQSHILGGQCNLWTEYIPSLAYAQYMIFPRACALAEVTWSAKSARDFDDFIRRLQIHEQRLDRLGVNYRKEVSPK